MELLKQSTDIKDDVGQILEAVDLLQKRLPDGIETGSSRSFMLNRYLAGLSTYAETVVDESEVSSNRAAKGSILSSNLSSALASNHSQPVQAQAEPSSTAPKKHGFLSTRFDEKTLETDVEEAEGSKSEESDPIQEIDPNSQPQFYELDLEEARSGPIISYGEHRDSPDHSLLFGTSS